METGERLSPEITEGKPSSWGNWGVNKKGGLRREEKIPASKRDLRGD